MQWGKYAESTIYASTSDTGMTTVLTKLLVPLITLILLRQHARA